MIGVQYQHFSEEIKNNFIQKSPKLTFWTFLLIEIEYILCMI